MDITELRFKNYYKVLLGRSENFHAIIAVHNINRGPGIGGCRYMEYGSHDSQLRDSLNLAQAMTYKCALAGLPAGGGKSTVRRGLGLSEKETFANYAELLNHINMDKQVYYTACDIGTNNTNLGYVAAKSKSVATGVQDKEDTGVATAHGVFEAMRSTLAALGIATVDGQRISISGLGKVGRRLAKLCALAEADLTVADIDHTAVQKTLAENATTNITVADPDTIHARKCDIFAPCGVGDAINATVVDALDAKIICGGANNQLAKPELADELTKRGITYVPDYLANAGGIIMVCLRQQTRNQGLTHDDPTVTQRIKGIGELAYEVVDRARAGGRTTSQVADEMAEKRFLEPPPRETA